MEHSFIICRPDAKVGLLSYKRRCRGPCRAPREGGCPDSSDTREDIQKAYTVKLVGHNKKPYPLRQSCYHADYQVEVKRMQNEDTRSQELRFHRSVFAILFSFVGRSFRPFYPSCSCNRASFTRTRDSPTGIQLGLASKVIKYLWFGHASLIRYLNDCLWIKGRTQRRCWHVGTVRAYLWPSLK